MESDALRTAGALILLTRALDHRLRELESDDLGVIDLSVMRQIERGHDLPSLVARALLLDPGRVTRITDHLVLAGYILRQQDEDDRRRCRLRLTPDGAVRLADGKKELLVAVEGLLQGMSVRERGDLEAGLEAARRELDNQRLAPETAIMQSE